MSDRYSKLFALSENLYSVGAPVVIAAGALQKDNQTGKVFAQLKIRNIQDKVIKAATVKIATFDTVGKPLGGTVDYQYLDLSAGRDTDFGQKTPVMLKEAATRSFAVSVSEVIFSDNSIWTASNEAWEPLSAPIAPEKEFTDGELAKQYRAKYGADCKCIFKKEKGLWRCACGAINHDSEKNCHSCQREAAALAALNVEELKADRDRRLAVEQKKAAEEKAAAAEQAKKTKKIAMIAAPIVVVAIVAAVLISNFVKAQQEEAARLDAYNAAVALAEAGQYDEAIAAFTELGDYKDSAEQINETTYNQAVTLLESENYDEAISIFTKLGNYKDSANQVEHAINLQTEVALLNDYRTAIDLLNTEPGTKEYYEAVAESRQLLVSLNGYRDSNELLQNFYTDIICALASNPKDNRYYQYDDEGKIIYDGVYTYSYHEDGTVDTFTSGPTTYKVVSYDSEGRMLRAEADSMSAYYTYAYDENGRLISRNWGGVDTPEEVLYTYDDNGRKVSSKRTNYMSLGYTIEHTSSYGYIDENGAVLSKGDSTYQIGWIYAPNTKR